MAAEKITQKVGELNADLLTWAQNFGHSQDPYVASLSDALQGGQDLEYWASIDPLEYLPSTDTVGIIPELRIARLLAAIRNVIIFLPVALTWAAVSEATKAFNEFVQTNTGTPANFLQFWQDGYGMLDDFWKIGTIAQADFIIVMIVIGFSAAVSMIQARGLSKASRMQARFSRERRLLGMRIKSYLFPFRTVKAADIPNDLAKSVTLLRQTIVESQSNLNSLQRSSDVLTDYTPALQEMGKTLVSLTEATEKSIEAMQSQTGKALESMLKETEQALELILTESAKSIDSVLSDIDGTSTSIKSTARGLQDQLESLQRQLARKK